ncbi:MAG: hypothetical protein O3A60_02760, partial [Planctomycetota bacterium]|nr:hypothetical protein [Planctomycetota bacterium]
LLGILPLNEVLPVDPDAGQAALSDEPVDVGTGHSSQGSGGADANVLVWVNLLCHALTVADRIPLGNGTRLCVYGQLGCHPYGRFVHKLVYFFDLTAGNQLREQV